MFSGIDYSGKYPSEELARKIASFWKEKGFDVNVWTEPVSNYFTDRVKNYIIKSDLFNGLPKK